MQTGMAGIVSTRMLPSGFGLGSTEPAAPSYWSGVFGDVIKGVTNIVGSVVTPPQYRTRADGTVEIRNSGLPSLQTGTQPQGGGVMPVPLAQTVQQATGVSTQTMFGVGAALLLVVLLTQQGGRR